jgi:hypothetical protein
MARNKNKNITITYQETLHPEKFPWYRVTITGYTTFELYQTYKELIPNEVIYAQIILRRKSNLRIKPKKIVEPIVPVVIPQQQELATYCYCRTNKLDINLVGKLLVNLFSL